MGLIKNFFTYIKFRWDCWQSNLCPKHLTEYRDRLVNYDSFESYCSGCEEGKIEQRIIKANKQRQAIREKHAKIRAAAEKLKS
jgi:predicted nucleotidyltransferase